MTEGLLWPSPAHTAFSQGFGRTTVAAELRSYEHNGYLVTDGHGPKVFRLARNGPIPGGTPVSLAHPALDQAMPVGTPIRAGESGHCVGHGIDSLTGEHWLTLRLASGVELFYTHLSRFWVAVGAAVPKGATIALSGATGNVTGPHLHWEVRSPTGAGPELDYPADRVNPARCIEGRDLAYYPAAGRFR